MITKFKLTKKPSRDRFDVPVNHRFVVDFEKRKLRNLAVLGQFVNMIQYTIQFMKQMEDNVPEKHPFIPIKTK